MMRRKAKVEVGSLTEDAEAAPDGAAATVARCVKVIKDPREIAMAKIDSIKAIDKLMVVKGESLGIRVAEDLKFLSQLARLTKEKDLVKKWPKEFAPKTPVPEVKLVLTATCELLDKWGRRYEGEDEKSPLYAFTKTRIQLQKDGVTLPSPEAYQFVESAVFGGPGGPLAEGSSPPLDEAVLTRMMEEAQQVVREHGPLDVRAADARARSESELQKWQTAAEKSAERNDFAEYERLSAVIHRVTAALQALEENTASAPAVTPSGLATPAGAASSSRRLADTSESSTPLADRDPVERRSRRKRREEAPSDTPAFGATVSAATEGAWPPEDDMVRERQDSIGDVGRRAQLEAQVQILQANNVELQSQLNQAHEQLSASLQRLRDVDSNGGLGNAQGLRAQLHDARASLATATEVNSQLQCELDHSRRDADQLRQQLGPLEKRLADRDEQISQTRQRLFEEKNRVARLEDDLKQQANCQGSLHDSLHEERLRHTSTENELRCVQRVVASGVYEVQQPCRASVPYSSGASPPDLTILQTTPKVHKCDELSGAVAESGAQEAPLQRLLRQQREAQERLGTEQRLASNPFGSPSSTVSAARGLARSSPDMWARTPRVGQASPVLVLRTPPVQRGHMESIAANFRDLLVNRRGPLYEDDHISLEFVASSGDTGRDMHAFEFSLSNRGGHVLQQVQLFAVEASERSEAFRIQIVPPEGGPASSGSTLWPQQRTNFRGRFEVFGPFEVGPHIEVSYLLPDNLCCRARLRLPLTVLQSMAPIQLNTSRLFDLWNSTEFVQNELAFICSVRPAFAGAGGGFLLGKCLELGGVLCARPGVDEGPDGIVLAATYPQRGAAAPEALVRAELGAPSAGAHANCQCRIAVRSASYLVNRSLGAVLLDALCDAGGLPAAAA